MVRDHPARFRPRPSGRGIRGEHPEVSQHPGAVDPVGNDAVRTLGGKFIQRFEGAVDHAYWLRQWIASWRASSRAGPARLPATLSRISTTEASPESQASDNQAQACW